MKNRNAILMAIVPVLACFALLPGARAVSPAPDGCFPNFTTAEGCDALSFLTTGAGKDRKSTRLNSSHSQISYAVFCLKKKNTTANVFSLQNTVQYARCQTLACLGLRSY